MSHASHRHLSVASVTSDDDDVDADVECRHGAPLTDSQLNASEKICIILSGDKKSWRRRKKEILDSSKVVVTGIPWPTYNLTEIEFVTQQRNQGYSSTRCETQWSDSPCDEATFIGCAGLWQIFDAVADSETVYHDRLWITHDVLLSRLTPIVWVRIYKTVALSDTAVKTC